ncbi:energy transducer TonB [Steroidobacter sp.]|uniref:energy transducer TonB n=1 Tax=Steroidobacter sp. TaxID=1978227 RepID=UPI001A57311F|nr:energy transducer TonB [Steroidobacter sp.]MBL8269288.1 energy transducer TonB [Steroidobacter sp.]
MNRSQHLLMGMFVAAAHVAVLAGVLLARAATPEPVVQQTMMVSFIPEQRATPVASPPPPVPQPPPRLPPKPAPTLVASTRPTPSPMVTPRQEEVVEAAPVEQPVAAPQVATAQETVVPPDYLADSLNNPGPQYPYASRRKREEGTVMLKVLVSASGVAEQVLIDVSSGYPSLDEAAADIVKRRWRFVPAIQNDRAVAAWVAIPMLFELKNR